jgi:hypothetical protein
MGQRQDEALAANALKMAIEQRRPRPGLVHHTDQSVLAPASFIILTRAFSVVRGATAKPSINTACVQAWEIKVARSTTRSWKASSPT